MIGRVHVRAVVGRELNQFDGPALSVGKVLGAQPGKSLEQHPGIFLVRLVVDPRPHDRRIEHGLVVKRHRKIEHPTGQLHGLFLAVEFFRPPCYTMQLPV